MPLIGYISSRCTKHQNISHYNVSMCIPDDCHLYGEWREEVKDQIFGGGFWKIHTFPDHHFQQIVTVMRALCPACDSPVTDAAGHNGAGRCQIKEAVVQPVKDCGMMLRITVKNHATGLAPLGKHGVFYDQIMVSDGLLPPNAPDRFGPTMTIANPGPVSQNVPPAYPP